MYRCSHLGGRTPRDSLEDLDCLPGAVTAREHGSRGSGVIHWRRLKRGFQEGRAGTCAEVRNRNQVVWFPKFRVIIHQTRIWDCRQSIFRILVNDCNPRVKQFSSRTRSLKGVEDTAKTKQRRNKLNMGEMKVPQGSQQRHTHTQSQIVEGRRDC